MQQEMMEPSLKIQGAFEINNDGMDEFQATITACEKIATPYAQRMLEELRQKDPSCDMTVEDVIAQLMVNMAFNYPVHLVRQKAYAVHMEHPVKEDDPEQDKHAEAVFDYGNRLAGNLFKLIFDIINPARDKLEYAVNKAAHSLICPDCAAQYLRKFRSKH